MAGFALSQLRFRGSRALFLGCLAALFIPFQVIMVPLARIMADTGLIDTYPGLILAYVAQFLPFTIYPDDELLQRPSRRRSSTRPGSTGTRCTASTGGSCCRWARPALLSVGILNALFCWNDVLISLLMMPSAEHRTLMVGVTSLRGQYSDDIPTFASGVLIAAVPVLVIYLFLQRQIADGVTAGSTKG